MRYMGRISDPKDLTTKEYVDNIAAAFIPMWFGTLAEYNELEEIDPNVCYCIEEGTGE